MADRFVKVSGWICAILLVPVGMVFGFPGVIAVGCMWLILVMVVGGILGRADERRKVERQHKTDAERKRDEDPCPLLACEIEMGARRRQKDDGEWETYWPNHNA